MQSTSIWEATSPRSSFLALSGRLSADAVVIGGGITGITAAMLLARAGKRVVVLEALQVGLGATGYSTGNLYATVDEGLHQIRSKWNADIAKAVALSRRETVDWIERIVAEQRISCEFVRRPHYIFALDHAQARTLQREYEALEEAGIEASTVSDAPLPLKFERGLKIENQAQFHPAAYVRALAQSIASDSCQIFESSKLVDFDGEKGMVKTAEGEVAAEHIILATHTPKGFNILQTELGPYREYGLAARLATESYPEGIFWTLESPSHSVRSCGANGTRYLIVVGELHKTGQQDEQVDYYSRVEEFTRNHFNVASVEYRWSAQHYRPADGLPYIGKSPGNDRVYVATGFATSGLVYGTLAASIIADEISGRAHPWRDVYDSRRFAPVKSAKEFVKENVNVAGQYAKDLLTRVQYERLVDVPLGEGRLVKIDGEKLAVFRDPQNQLTVLSAICPHLGCVVHWNRLENTWDCPCHGSRFRCDGAVIEGPAIGGLKRKQIAS